MCDDDFSSRGCHDDYLVTHKQTASDMKEKHRSLTTSGRLCATQLRKRYAHFFYVRTRRNLVEIRSTIAAAST